MGRLRDQMLMEMELRSFSANTVDPYLRYVTAFSIHFGKSPAQMGDREIREYLYYLRTEHKASSSSITIAYSALKFLYVETLHREWPIKKHLCPKKEKKLPVVLSREEVTRIFDYIGNLKHSVMLKITYSAGLRVSETAHLRISDIDSSRMQIRVDQGKGRKDRYTLLSERLLEELRHYYRRYKPTIWLFEGQNKGTPISVRGIQKAFKQAKKRAGIKKPATVHTLRHSFATHLLEDGTNIFTIQRLLGHSSLRATSVYIHLQREDLKKIVSPLDRTLDGTPDGIRKM